MTNISINTHLQDGKAVLELSWFDVRLRRPAHVRVGMDREAIEDLIGKLQGLSGGL